MSDWLHVHAALVAWLRSNEVLLAWLAGASAATFVASLIAVPWLVVRIPADYFARGGHHHFEWAHRRPVLHATLMVLKNLAGAVLLLAGIAMLVLPGQGLLTIFIGVLLLDFPGKVAFERRIVSRPAILHPINWLRQRHGRPPLSVDGGP